MGSAWTGAGLGIEAGEEQTGLFVTAFVEVVEEVGAGALGKLAGEEIELGEDGADGAAGGGGGFEFEDGVEDGLFDGVHGFWLAVSVGMAKAGGVGEARCHGVKGVGRVWG